jgi:hypothetical protein
MVISHGFLYVYQRVPYYSKERKFSKVIHHPNGGFHSGFNQAKCAFLSPLVN